MTLNAADIAAICYSMPGGGCSAVIRVTDLGDHWAHALCDEHGKRREPTVAAVFRLLRGFAFYNRTLRGSLKPCSTAVLAILVAKLFLQHARFYSCPPYLDRNNHHDQNQQHWLFEHNRHANEKNLA